MQNILPLLVESVFLDEDEKPMFHPEEDLKLKIIEKVIHKHTANW